MATKKADRGMMGIITCCGSWVGLVHLVGGIGLGFLLASYVTIPSMIMWGWILLGLSLLGHVLGWTRCKNCGM